MFNTKDSAFCQQTNPATEWNRNY